MSQKAERCRSCSASGERNSAWRGGRTVDKDGYVLVKVGPDDPMASMRNSEGYVREHRLVVARSIGRPLTIDEDAHHRNEVKDDNRLENLQLMTASEHRRLHGPPRRAGR